MRFYGLLLGCFLLSGCGDTPGGVATPPPERISARTESLSLNSGWNGVAFPCQKVAIVEPNGKIPGFCWWDGTVYQTRAVTSESLNEDEGGRRGYWMFATEPTSLAYEGTGDGRGDRLNLRVGWNLVSFAALGPVSVPLSSVVLPTAYRVNPDNTYTAVELGSVEGGRPYWIFAGSSMTLVYTVGGATPGGSPAPAGSPTPGGSPGPVASPAATPVASPPLVPGGSPSPAASPVAFPSTILESINDVRGAGGLPAVGENLLLAPGAVAHAGWQVLNNSPAMVETLASPGFSLLGQSAAVNSIATTTSSLTRPAFETVAALVTDPSQGSALLDPLLQSVGLGNVTNGLLPATVIRASQVVNVLASRLASSPVPLPLAWPAHGAVTKLTGAPLYVFLGTAPSGTTATLTRVGSGLQDLAVLEPRAHCLALVPSTPLVRGATYTVNVVSAGRTVNWTFTVAVNAL